MEIATEEYRGYTIEVTPMKDCEDMWDYEYRIIKAEGGKPVVASTRSRTAGGHLTPEVARLAGLEVARTEVDYLLAH